MIGIYKITNIINNHCYIGQSRNIQKRWKNHISASHNCNEKSYEYPLYRAIRKYGVENFSFDILEETTVEQLNEREQYWIKYYNPEYNQTIGGDYQVIPQKLTVAKVEEIQNILLNDKEGKLSYGEIAEKYNVHRDTIRDINLGRTWINPKLIYPLHHYKFNSKKTFYCIDCGKEISHGSVRCKDCEVIRRRKKLPVTKEELKNLIRTKSFLEIGRQFNVTDNAIRKWCDRYSLPRRKKDIKKYTDAEWAEI